MKKELFAVVLLALILAFSIFNTAIINSICDGIDDLIGRSAVAAERGDWDESGRLLDEAKSLWERNETYTSIVLRHTDIETLTSDFYEFTEHVCSEDAPAVRAAASLIGERLKSVKNMESINLGSIF